MRALFQAWDRKDPAVVALWEKTRQWSLDELHAIFAQLGAPIDVYFFESEVEEPGRAIVKDLLERGIAEVSDGLPVVKIDEKLGLEKETYRTLPILRSDGTTLYATKDLALAAVKFDQYQVDAVDLRRGLGAVVLLPAGLQDARTDGLPAGSANAATCRMSG